MVGRYESYIVANNFLLLLRVTNKINTIIIIAWTRYVHIILYYEITWIKQYIKCLIEGKLPAVYIECEGAAESVTGSGVGNS